MHQKVNFYISALIITIVGSFATYLIIRVDMEASTEGYVGASVSSNPDILRLQEELNESY